MDLLLVFEKSLILFEKSLILFEKSFIYRHEVVGLLRPSAVASMCRRQRQSTMICPAANKLQPQPWCNSRLFLVSAQNNAVLLAGNAGMQDLQNLQRQLDEKTIECESLEGSLEEALDQAVCATNDAEMWHGAYQQTVEADLERQNGKLLYENRQLRAEVKQAQAATERAGESLVVFCSLIQWAA